MILKQTAPTTKQSVISSLQQLQIGKIEVKEPQTQNDLQDISKALKTFYGNGSKPISVIFLKGR
jgi:hypothetical protein